MNTELAAEGTAAPEDMGTSPQVCPHAANPMGPPLPSTHPTYFP